MITRAPGALSVLAVLSALGLAGCGETAGSDAANAAAAGPPFGLVHVAALRDPLAIAFLPDGRMLVAEKMGKLRYVTQDGKISQPLSGVPPVAAAGQGGLADIAVSPDFFRNQYVYLSYAEPGPNGTAGVAVGRARLTEVGLEDFQVIWRQEPKVAGTLQFSGRMAFSPDGFLYIGSGDRGKSGSAQDMGQNLGKIVRLTDAGMIPSDNPFYDQGRVKAQIWSSGHRNPTDLAFDRDSTLWEVEMGPRGGDELNIVVKGRNYGWPIVSNGRNYDGTYIPDHGSRPEFEAPKASWTPVISPSSLMIYSGDMFPEWRGSAFIGSLSGKALIRVVFDGSRAYEADRFPMGARVRDIAQGPDGSIWLLEDGHAAKLLRLIPPA